MKCSVRIAHNNDRPYRQALPCLLALLLSPLALGAEATDNFNRANGGLGSNWTRNADDGGTLQIVSNAVQPTAGTYGESLWTAATFGAAQFSEAKHVSGLSAGVINLVVRVRQYSGGGGTSDSYRGQFSGFESAWKIIRVDNDVETILASGALSYANGDTYRVEATGTTIRVFNNGVQLGSTTDATYSGGDVGVGTYNHVNLLIDDWRGGDLSTDTTAPTVPTGFTAASQSSSLINLAWIASTDQGGSGLASYRVERCTGASCSNFGEIATVLPPTVSYADSGLSASTTYRYRVRAVDGAANYSAYTAVVDATTFPGSSDATDDFNRANGGLGANWTTVNTSWGTHLLQIVSNQVQPAADEYAESVYTAQSFGSNQFSEVQYVNGLADGVINLVVRDRQYTTSGTNDSYRGQLNGFSGQWRILRVDNTVETELATGSLTSAAGDTFYFEANGSTLTLKRNGVTLGTVSDSTYTTGEPGLGQYNVGNLFADNWRGGVLTGGGGDTEAPAVPANLIVVASSSAEIDLAWSPATDNVAVTQYRLERCSGASCSNFAQIATPVVTQYENVGLSPNTVYRYRVLAADAATNSSGWSNTLTVTTPTASADCN